MKNFFCFLLLIVISIGSITPLFSATELAWWDSSDAGWNSEVSSQKIKEIQYPTGDDFLKLKSIIENTFSQAPWRQYKYSCIFENTLCPNYKYTSITEKTLKFIVLKTYTDHADFYQKLFLSQSESISSSSDMLAQILSRIPKGLSLQSDIFSFWNPSSISSTLLDASFGVDFTENNTSGMLGAIEGKIKEMRQGKCFNILINSPSNTAWRDCDGSIIASNIYLPTPSELFAENIYLNGKSVKIGDLKDEFEYTLSGADESAKIVAFLTSRNKNSSSDHKKISDDEMKILLQEAAIDGNSNASILLIEYSDMECPFCIKQYHETQLQKNLKPKYGDNIAFVFKNNKWVNHPGTEKKALAALCVKHIGGNSLYVKFVQSIMEGTPNISQVYSIANLWKLASSLGIDEKTFQTCLDSGDTAGDFAIETDEAKGFGLQWTPGTLVLNTKTKEYITIEWAYPLSDFISAIDALLVKNIWGVDYTPEYIASYNPTYTLRYKKNSYTLDEAKAVLEKNTETFSGSVVVLTQDGWIMSSCNDLAKSYKWKLKCTALSAISTTLWAYYADKESYPDSLDDLNQNYLPKWQLPEWFKENFSYKKISNEDFEIRYIGTPDEEATTPSSQKSDYKALMSGSTLPEIPAIFTHVPSDSMVLYVKNPTNLLDILDQKSNTTNRLSGFDVSQSIKEFITTFFEIEDFTNIQKNLKHEMAVVVNNLDATAPDIVFVLSQEDKDALSPTLKTRVIGSKDGYIFIASSKQSIEKITGLTPEKSMKNAPDFQYVWWKKSQKVNDALMFVGDEFFEKVLTLETYITHYRKYRDYAHLLSLQELVWAYSDAFWKNPTSLSDMTSMGLSSLTGSLVDEYSINDEIVSHKNIWSLKSLNTLPEANYDLSKISRTEIEDYKSNILKYKEVWRSSLDPMGIVLNRYGDGMEMDFFMTPIPFLDGDFKEFEDFVQWIAKEKLSFVNNSHIRMGLISFIFWIDGKKIQEKINSKKELQSGFIELNKEFLDGKNIFDYIAWEMALSIGGIDSDMFDGWNIEKVDIYGSLQVTSEEKWKELIDMIRAKVLAEFGNGSTDETDMIKWFLAKPLIEDYKEKKIYYVEWLPIPFIGKIGFAYTFVDDFFMIAPNRSTIKRIIDTSLMGDVRKEEIVDPDGFESGTLLVTLFDGESLSQNMKWLYEKNQSYITRYSRYIDELDMSDMNTLLGTYYSQEDKNKRLGKTQKPFSYTFGSVSIGGNPESLTLKIDENQLKNLTGSALQSWENLKNSPKFPKEIITHGGIPFTDFPLLDQKWDILGIIMISHLNTAFSWGESLFRNATFGFTLGNNEVGFSLKVFREPTNLQKQSGFAVSSAWVIGGILFFLALWGGCVWFFVWRKKRPIQKVNTPIVLPITTTPDLWSDLLVPVQKKNIEDSWSNQIVTEGVWVSLLGGDTPVHIPNTQNEKSI